MPNTEIHTGKFTVQRLPSLAAPPVLPSATLETLPPSAPCANCGADLIGPYCAQCGQHVADYHRSVWRFVADFFDNTFCWDNKLFRTLKPLVRQPGFLTLEFMEGRRVRYVHPLRLFLFTSAVCLAVLQMTHTHMAHLQVDRSEKPHKGTPSVHVNFGDAPLATASSPVPTVTKVPEAPSSSVSPTPDADGKKDEPAGADPHDGKALAKQIRRELAKERAKRGANGQDASDPLAEKIENVVADRIDEAGDGKKLGEELVKNVQQRLSWVALALLPVFALVLRAVYWRKDSFYFVHLVFSLHYHTFLLVYLALYSIAQTVADFLPFHALVAWLLTPIGLIPPVYFYLALRRLYGERRRRTVVKVLVVGFIHLVLIVIGVSAVGTYSFFF